MASPQGSENFSSRNKVEMLDFDVDATTAAAATYVDLRDYDGFAVMIKPSVLAGSGVTKLEIVAADDTSGTNITVIKDSGTVAADAIDDYVYLECQAEEVRQESEDASATLRFVAARVTHDNAGDESVITYIRFKAKHATSGLTANNITT